jgi:hypothetical protein
MENQESTDSSQNIKQSVISEEVCNLLFTVCFPPPHKIGIEEIYRLFVVLGDCFSLLKTALKHFSYSHFRAQFSLIEVSLNEIKTVRGFWLLIEKLLILTKSFLG